MRPASPHFIPIRATAVEIGSLNRRSSRGRVHFVGNHKHKVQPNACRKRLIRECFRFPLERRATKADLQGKWIAKTRQTGKLHCPRVVCAELECTIVTVPHRSRLFRVPSIHKNTAINVIAKTVPIRAHVPRC